MSGLADLASWALRGGANNNNNNNDDDGNNNNNNRNDSAEAPLTAEEMRAQRLARMEEQQQKKKRQQQQQEEEENANNNNGGSNNNDKDTDDPMDIDPSPPSSSATAQQAGASAASALATSSSALSSLSTSPTVVDSKKGARSSSLKPAPAVKQSAPASCTPNHKESKKKKSSHNASASPSDGATTRATNKTQRKKELLLKKILHVRLEGSSIPSDAGSSTSTTVELDLDDGSGSGSSAAAADISVSSMAMIVATRLSVEPPAPTSPHRLSHHLSSAAASAMGSMANDHHSLHYQKKYPPLIAYLAGCHVRACEEIRSMKQSSGGGGSGGLGGSGSNHKKQASQNAETAELVNEIRKLVVNYAASCIAEPGLFPGSDDAANQLARCLLNGLTDVSNSITFGLGGGGASTSFYYCLCEELLIQDSTGRLLESTVRSVVAYYTKQLGRPGGDSVLEGGGDFGVGGTGSNTCSPTMLVTALQAVCLHKRAALAVTGLECFLLPSEGTTEASQTVRNTPPAAMAGGGMTAANVQLLQMLAGEVRSYKKRSGPALEKDTLLGLALRVGAPKNNPAFVPTSILRQSVDSVERSSLSQRQLLRSHQEACHALIMSLIKAGPVARERVLRWFQDALAVNVGADAYRPDQTKVSGTNLLLNTTTVLLKLCQPFVDDASKRHLIDPGFVRSEKDHGGVYATAGDDAVARLGGDDDEDDENYNAAPYEYAPKNAFIPKCFFFCARSLHFGIVPALAYHEILLRHINHAHWEISNRNGDVHSDPNFAHLICRQRSAEVPLFQDEMVHDTLRFCNLMAVCLLEMPDDHLKHMAEHFVSDVCSVVQGVAKMKPRLLRNVHVENVFCIVVKLLSAKYATMVRNYNLRATLGDVLYELYLPPTAGDRREVPPSVSCDAAGRTLLLSNAAAQETLAPSLLLLYGEVEHTGYYDKMSHRAKIASLLKYLWESNEHRPAFRRITQNEKSFVKFANGIMNETNTLIATVMQKLPEIRASQEQMKNVAEWGLLSEDQQGQITARLEDNEREVKHALPLCNKTLQMFGYLNTDPDIRSLFCLEELCPRLVTMLLHVLTKLVGSKGLDLKVDNPEQYDFRPKEMLRDLCAIFALFSSSREFQVECAKSGCDPALLRSAVKTCQRLVLLTGESMTAFEALPAAVRDAAMNVKADEALIADAPDEFLDEILSTYMKDPVILPSGHTVDRSTITQHLLNDETDPFNREPMTVADIKPASELKVRMNAWLLAKQRKQQQNQDGAGKEEEMEMDAGAETHS